MNPQWQTSTVSELQARGYLLVEDGNHGEYRPRPNEFSHSGVSFIRAADMDSGRILFEKASRINNVALNRIRKGVGRPGDVLLSHKGTVGKVAMAPLGCEPFVCSPQTTFWRVLNEKHLDRRYLYAFLNSNHFKQQLNSRKGETDMADYVSLTTQRSLRVVLPPLPEQRAIAHILGTLDDKIENNRRMNETLEAMAQALFKSWFVDFDPVRAKMEGRQPVGMDAETAALFTDRLVDSEIGEIPEGWGVTDWGEIATLEYGKGLRGYQEANAPYRVFGTNGPIGWHTEFLCPSEGIIIGRKGAYRGIHYSPNPFFVIDTAFYVKPIEPMSMKWAYYELLTNDINSMDSGSAIPSTSREAFYRLPVCFPPRNIQDRFEQIVSLTFQTKFANDNYSEGLAIIRDALLPKLLSGELQLSE